MCNYYAPHSGRSLRNRLGIQLVPRSGIVRRAEPPDGFTAFVSRSGRAAHGIDSIHPSMDRDRAVQEVLRAACSIDLSTRTSVGIPLPRRQALRRGRATGGQPRVRRTLPPLSHCWRPRHHARARARTYVRHPDVIPIHTVGPRLSHGKYTWDEAVATLAGAYRNVLACSLASQQATAQY